MRTLLLCLFLFGAVFSNAVPNDSYADSLLRELDEPATDTAKVRLLIEAGQAVFRKDPNATAEFAQKAIHLADSIGFPDGIASARSLMGISLWARGKYQDALTYQKQALELFKSLGNKRKQADVLNNIGAIHHSQSDYDIALTYFIRSASICEEIGDHLSMAHSYNNIGILHKNQGDYPKAAEYYDKSLQIYLEYGDENDLGPLYYNLGVVQMALDNIDAALEYHLKSLRIKEENEDVTGLANSYTSLGTIFKTQLKYDDALLYLEKAIELMRETGNRSGEAINLHSIAQVYLDLGKFREAHTAIDQSQAIAKELGAKNTIAENYRLRSELFEALGSTSKALEYYKLYHELSDSIFNSERSAMITEIQSKYDMQRQANEIRILNQEQTLNQIELEQQQQALQKQRFLIWFTIVFLFLSLSTVYILFRSARIRKRANRALELKNKEIERQKNELESLNATKDKFFKIIAHDLRNPFTSMLSITDSVHEQFKELEEEEQIYYISRIRASARKLYELLENLLNWAVSQTGEIRFKPVPIKLKTETDSCISLVLNEAEKKDIVIESRVDDNLVINADADMLRTILRNLLSNAVKFSCEEGSVCISASRENGNAIISVVDEGVGMTEGEANGLFSLQSDPSPRIKRPGCTAPKGTGLGLILCREFVHRHGGEIKVSSVVGKGSRFDVILPINPE